MAKADRGAKSKKTAEFLRTKGVVRTTGNCPLCHHLITNGTLHAPALCKPRRRQHVTIRPVSRETVG